MSLRLRLLLAVGAVALTALAIADVVTYRELRSFLYGRIDHDSLGRSCYSVATELVSIGKVDEALESYECAVRSLRLGDVFGRVDERKLSKALMDGAGTYRTAGRTDRAAVWEQEAVAIEATSRRVIT